ncbi:MAG: acetyl-CoA carboxylase carboxyl transferase subunit beta [Coriobacteriales bacterium]|jgi:acetyl-CoA carboxylase carboxyl transferase subunit beta|nr:acetyl-CoA carboxylase carboxyl transferase subunit beta [Coriobacteriales bacterium]
MSDPTKKTTEQQRLSSPERIVETVDEDSFEEWDADLVCSSPFPFPVYDERIGLEQEKTGCVEAVSCGRATISGAPVAIVAMNPYFLMGSMGSTVGEKITRAIERAADEHLPLIVFSASGGARMQEGLGSLLQMAKISCALARFSTSGVPYISVLTDPTTGGVMAALSSQGDIILAEGGPAQIGFTGRRVIEATFRPQFPPDFQSPEFALSHGLVDAIVPRAQMREVLYQLITLHQQQGHEIWGSLPVANSASFASPREPLASLASSDVLLDGGTRPAWEKVGLARRMDRPTARSYVHAVVSDFVELHGDREFGDDGAIIAGIGCVGGVAVTVIAQEKGTTTAERIAANFGCVRPEGYRKAIRVAKQAEKFNRPVICFVDTQGAHCGVESEERGQGNAIGDCLVAMAGLRVPVISVLLGEGGSGGALALALANSIGMMENAIYSVCSPEAYASILWKDPTRAAEAAQVMHLTARDALKLAAIDEILPEPPEGAHADAGRAARAVSDFLTRELTRFSQMSADMLAEGRQQRFRDFLRPGTRPLSDPVTLDVLITPDRTPEHADDCLSLPAVPING